MSIHPTAIIAKTAKLDASVEVGPYCVIAPHVTIGAGTKLISHVSIEGHTTIGENNIIYPFASLGHNTPDRKYKGEPTTLTIGDGNDIREYVTMHIGTAADKGTTTVGSNNLFMAGSHVAHDCVVGSNCTIANYVQLAGHVVIEDNVTIGGLTGIQQRVRVGRQAIIGGHTGVDYDVPPYASVSGSRGILKGLNLVGLRRKGYERSLIQALDEAYTYLFDTADEKPLQQRAAELKEKAGEEEIKHLADFVMNSQRGVTAYEDDE